MSTKRVFMLLTMFIMSVLSVSLSTGSVYATETMGLKQVYGWDQYMDMFITDSLGSDTLSVRVSNHDAVIDGQGVCVDEGITSKTTILIDVSKSVPNSTRGKVFELLNALIESTNESEELKMVLFDESLTPLTDFTSDRYELVKAIDKIQFEGNQSMIYDAIYNTIPDVAPNEGEPCYYRTIIITDGVDDTASGITKEELYLELQNKTYPIDVVEVTKSEADPNKNLAALNRISNGEYNQLNSSSDVGALANGIRVDKLYWIRVVVPGVLADGSVRQVDVDAGNKSIRFDTKVAVYDGALLDTENNVEEIDDEPVEAVTVTAEEVEEPEKTEEKPKGITVKKLIIMGSVGVIGLLGIVLLIVFLMTSKKKNPREKRISRGATTKLDNHSGLLNTNQAGNTDETEFVGIGNDLDSNENVEGIRLRNTSDASQVWNIKFEGDVIIGREEGCQVCILESSVSRKQCKITKNEFGVEVTNLSTSNKTLLNGETLTTPRKIKSGDKLKCGRIILIVELLNHMYSVSDADLNRGTEFINI